MNDEKLYTKQDCIDFARWWIQKGRGTTVYEGFENWLKDREVNDEEEKE